MGRNLIRTQKGSSLVEFTIFALLLFILLFGIIEFSIALYDKAVLTNASREGARLGIVAQSPRVPTDINVGIRNAVRNYASAYLITFGADPDTLTDDHIAITWTDITGDGYNFGDNLTVSVSYRYDFLVLSRLITALGVDLTLNATTVMKLE